MENISDFNADKARELAESKYNQELLDILQSIKNKCEFDRDNRTLHINKKLSVHTIKTLKEKGFNVSDFNSIALQRDGLYYTITW